MELVVRRIDALSVLVGILAANRAVQAQLPVARLDSVFPAGGRLGTTVEITATGAELDDVQRLHFSQAGIEATPVGERGANRFAVTVSNSVPVGNYEVRVVGRFGISNPRIFAVGDLPEVLDPTTNSSPATALGVSLGTVINGQATAARSDYFRVSLRTGQRVLVECAAAELDSKMDSTLRLYTPDGRELESKRRGGILDYTAATVGDVMVRVYDTLNRGGSEFGYRLTISDRPHIDWAVPAATEPGTNRAMTLFGRNLPGGSPVGARKIEGKLLEKLEVRVNSDAADGSPDRLPVDARPGSAAMAVDGFAYRLSSTNGVSNPVWLSRGGLPPLTEVEPNNRPEEAQAISLPVELAAEFEGAQDSDWYSFSAKQGESWVIEIISQRTGHPTDPSIHLVRRTKGPAGVEEWADAGESYDSDAGFGTIDFKTATGDPRLRFEAREDGDYRLLVRDQSGSAGGGFARPYQLIVRRPTPDFRLATLPLTPPHPNKDSKEIKVWTSFLRQGGVLPIRVMAFRRDGMDEDILISAEGLPPGVTSAGARLAGADGRSTLLLLQADETVKSWSGPIRIVGKAATKAGELVHSARPATVTWGVASYELEGVQTRAAAEVMLSVSAVEVAPLQLILNEQKPLDAALNGRVSVPVRVVRRAEFPGDAKLKLLGHPVLGGGRELDLGKQATNAVFELDLTQLKLPVGEHWLYVETQTAFKAERSGPALKLAEAATTEVEKTAAQAKTLNEQAKVALAAATNALWLVAGKAPGSAEAGEALKPLQEAKELKARQAEIAARDFDAAEKAKAAAQEKVKLYAKRDYTDTFYSMPILLRVTPVKPGSAPTATP